MADTRLQSSMRTHLIKNVNHGNKISKIELGRITKVNYQTNSVGFFLLTTGVNGERASGNKEYSAVMPMSMAGRNGYGKAYGDMTPVRNGDIILVGFVDDKTYRPIVIGIYPDENISKELSRSTTNDIDPSADTANPLALASFKVYPDQTYDFHDGMGTRVLSFSGHSFLQIDADANTDSHLDHKTDDGNLGLDYTDLPSSYLGNKELIEPISDTAPEIIFKHKGIVDSDHNPDTHVLYLYISPDGTYRVSQMKTDEDWRTYFEIKNSKIHLVRQKNSKFYGGIDVDNLQSTEMSIDEDGNLILRNHNIGIMIKPDGVYDLAGSKLLATKSAISDLILDKLGSLGFGGANLFSKTTATLGKFLDAKDNLTDDRNSLVSDYISVIGNNAYYAYAYAENDTFDSPVTFTLNVYDSDKKFIEGKSTKDIANVQIATRALPINASYIRVSISDSSVPIMVSYGTDYSAYQPSYEDVKAKKNNVSNTSDQLKQDYLNAKTMASDALSEKVLALQNISEALDDSQLSTADKQLLKSYVDYANSNYQADIALAYKYEISVDEYKKYYNQVLGRINPIISDMTTSTVVVSSQIKDTWELYFTNRCNLINRVANSSQSLYEASERSVNNAQIQQGNSMLKQFTDVSQTLESITQATKWTVWTDALDLNEEKITENLLFKGSHILNSPVSGSQYIQVFSALTSRSANSPVGVTQRVWSTESVTSYSRVLAGNTWSEWTLDSANSSYDSEFNKLTNSLANIDDKLADTSNDLSATKESIKEQINNSSVTLAQYKTSNDARVGNIEQKLTDYNKSFTDLLKRVITLETNYSSLVNDLNSAKTDINTSKTNVTNLTKKYSILSDNYDALSKRVTNLENKK